MGYNKTPGGDSKLGRTYSESGKQKLSRQRLGKPKTEEHKLHIGQGNRGKVRTPEMRLNMSKARKGVSSKRSHESFVEAAHKKRIMCNETGIIYKSISEAAKSLNLCTSGISAQLHKKQKTVKGFTFTEIINN